MSVLWLCIGSSLLPRRLFRLERHIPKVPALQSLLSICHFLSFPSLGLSIHHFLWAGTIPTSLFILLARWILILFHDVFPGFALCLMLEPQSISAVHQSKDTHCRASWSDVQRCAFSTATLQIIEWERAARSKVTRTAESTSECSGSGKCAWHGLCTAEGMLSALR